MASTLMGDGVLEFAAHYTPTYLAGKGLHVKIVEEGSVRRLASDSRVLQQLGKRLGIYFEWVAYYRFWLLEAKEI